MNIPRCLLALVLLGGLLAQAEAAPWVAGLHHMTIHSRKIRILQKLKNLLKK